MLELVDKATAPLKEIYGSSTQASKALQAQREELKKLSKSQSNISSFRQLSGALKQTKADLEDAQSSAARLALEYSKTEKPTRSMTKQFELARQKVKQLKQAEQEQNVQLSLLRSGLSKAGISTKSLANEEKALKSKIDASTQALRKKQLQVDKQIASEKRLIEITKKHKKTQELMGNMTSSGLGAGAAAATGGAAMIVPIKLSIDFESAMADVKKVIDFDTPQQFKQMNDDIISLSKRLPMTANEIAQIVALGGQSGIKKSELLVFAEDAVKMGVAFDITAEESGQAMAEMRTAFKMSQNEVTALSDKINYLGNNSPAAAKGIMNIVQRIGPLGEVGGFASGSIAALGATIRGMGVEEEIAATGIKNLMLALVAGESATKGQKAAFEDLGLNSKQIAQSMQKDAEGTTLKVLKAVSKLDKYKQAAVLKDLFGSESLGSIAPLLTNMDALQKNLGLVGDKTKYAGSMQAEYDSRAATTENNLKQFINGLKATGITIGNNLLPSLNELLTEGRGIIDMMQNWASKHPVLVGNISKVIIVIIALLAAFSAISLGIVALLGPMALMRMMFGVLGVKGFGLIRVIKLIGSTLAWLGKAFLMLGRFMLANPLILAITLLAVAAYLIYRNWGSIKAFFSDIWNSIKSGASQLWQSLVGFFSSGIANISTVILNWSPMGLFYKVFASVMSYFGIQLPSTFTGFGQMLMQGLANGIGNAVGAVVAKAKEVASKITNTVKGAFGIHSPSRVFAELGAYNMQGLAIGIDKNSSLPAAAVSNASKDMLGSFDTSGIRFDTRPSISSQSPRAAAATATPMQLTINVYPSAGMDEKSLAQMVAAEVAKFQRAPTSNPRSYNDID
ncbi:phage tail tape measure protein [Acinetobacter venetianus]|nr:phage tail tape measure protein [Acinetobacter venetianus]